MKLQPFVFRTPLALIAAVSLAFGAVGSLAAAAPEHARPGLPKAAPAQTTHNTTLTQAIAAEDLLAALPAEAAQPPAASAQAELEVFAAAVTNGQGSILRGVYAPGVLALRVVQQPAGAFSLDMSPGVATQFSAASAYGVTGLLADNIASGVEFYNLAPGQEVVLVYGDGAQRRYVVGSVARFQALSPTNPYSDFLDLASGARLSSSALFSQMYSGGDKVTFQTCLAQDGLMTWGRLFVTAYPAP